MLLMCDLSSVWRLCENFVLLMTIETVLQGIPKELLVRLQLIPVRFSQVRQQSATVDRLYDHLPVPIYVGNF